VTLARDRSGVYRFRACFNTGAVVELPKAFRAALADRYVIEGEIGHGSLATIFLAHDLRHSRHVALKVLRPDADVALSDVRFVREIKFLAQLQHPNIVPLHDSGHVGGLLYYVMPHIRGESLRERLDREKTIPVRDALRIVGQVAEALDYAHRHGVIHRDIKPANIILSGGHALVADFGIARSIGLASGQQLTTIRSIGPGTPAYMSPEQLIPGQELDGRTDIYALATVLYEVLTGELPFRHEDGRVDNVRKLSAPPPSARLKRPDVPEAVDRAIIRGLAAAPSERFSSASEFARALSDGVSTETPRISGTSPAVSTPSRAPVRAIVIAVVVSLLLLLGWLAFTGRFGTGTP
jgi:serine/threonine-protein kinase